MGHQESVMFCEDKEELKSLCVLLNYASNDESKSGFGQTGMQVFEIARLKKQIVVADYSGEVEKWQEGEYFVWWGGDRCYQSGDWLYNYMNSHFSPGEPGFATFWLTFVEYLRPSGKEILEGIEEGHEGTIQENDFIRTLHPDRNGAIDLALIDNL